MSYFDKIKKEMERQKQKEKQQKKSQSVIQKPKSVIQKPKSVIQQEFHIKPKVKSLDDIPNLNIMTSGSLLGIRLRNKKREMLINLNKYIEELIKK